MKVATIKTIRALEAAIDGSLMSYGEMMQRAGQAAADHLCQRLRISSETRITVLIGAGNNGGDGLVMAQRLAHSTDAQIQLYLLAARAPDDRHLIAAASAGIFIGQAADDRDGRLLKNLIRSADVIVDALFGIGLRLPLPPPAVKLLRTVRQLSVPSPLPGVHPAALDPTQPHPIPRAPRPFVLALDCPSGIDCDSGAADPNTLPADETLTFIAAKPGLFTFPAAKYVGRLLISPIGVPDSFPALAELSSTVLNHRAAAALLPARPIDGHKGTFGKTLVVAGSANYIGAAALAGEAAGRSGSGLVTIATTSQLVDAVAGRLREPTYLRLDDEDGCIAPAALATLAAAAPAYDALLIGCGLGQHPSTRAFVMRLLDSPALPPLILDADALNALSQQPNWWQALPPDAIITPHAGEMARLCGLPNAAAVKARRWQLAAQKAQEWDLTVVLKGAHTLVAAPSGAVSVIPFKTDALGTAGTGDILAGLIAGLRGQGCTAFDSARLGAYVHGLAGTRAQQEIGSSRSVIAGDLLPALGAAFAQVAG